ncbi:MAG: cellulase family glycosylhydrolase, partial [Bacteroidales bacterium]|nr:cellulase family glycosylhydrolase [Bacteroidales bacterium]
MYILLQFLKSRAATLFFLFSFLFISGCKRDEEPPLVFKPIDLQLFSETHKGFNLLGKFDAGWSNTGFQEDEFEIIKDLGFNFARLPLDYRTYTQTENLDVFIEEECSEIDDAVEWGRKHGIHVCINLHRAPGYCVNNAVLPANQDLDLWTNPAAQEVFVNHWEFFAERYRDIPYNELSFNLINEPGDIDEGTYFSVMKKAIDKIQRINPDRIIFVDGLKHGRQLVPSFKGIKNIIQAIHVYDPVTLTHYKAGWVPGAD